MLRFSLTHDVGELLQCLGEVLLVGQSGGFGEAHCGRGRRDAACIGTAKPNKARKRRSICRFIVSIYGVSMIAKMSYGLRNDTETMPLGDPILVAKLLIFHSILRFCLLFSCYLRKQAGHKAHS